VSVPPQTIIRLPVHTAVCPVRALGALVVDTGVQLATTGAAARGVGDGDGTLETGAVAADTIGAARDPVTGAPGLPTEPLPQPAHARATPTTRVCLRRIEFTVRAPRRTRGHVAYRRAKALPRGEWAIGCP